MRRNLIRESTEAATRLVVVKDARRVFVVRRFGVDRLLRAQGIANSLGATSAQLAKAQVDREITDAAIDERVALVQASNGDEAAANERKQLEDLARAGAEKLTDDQQIALYIDEVFPLVAACVSHIGELRPDVEQDGLLPLGTRIEDVCVDITDNGHPEYVMPVTLTFSDDADPEKGELAIWTLGGHAIAFGNAVIEAATDFRLVALPPASVSADAGGGQVGETVRPTPLRAALGSRSVAGRA